MSGPAELAGALGQRLSVLRRGTGTDALGAPDDGWAEVARVRAGLRPSARRPGDAEDGVASLGRWRVTLRPADVRQGDRLAGAGLDLTVLHVTRDPARPDRIVAEAEEIR